MPVDTPETRTLIHLRTGSKICVIVAVCLIAVAVYYYFVPMSVHTNSGGVFQCGSAAHPPSSTFQQNVCQDITHVDLYRTFLFAAAGILVAALGCWFFGVDRSVEERKPRVYDDELDEPDARDRRAGRRRDGAEGEVDGDAQDDTDDEDRPRRRQAERGRRRRTEDQDVDGYDDTEDHTDDEDRLRRRQAERSRRRRAEDRDGDQRDVDEVDDDRPVRRSRRDDDDDDERRLRRRIAVDTED